MHTRRLLTFTLGAAGKVPDQPPPYFPQPIFEAGFEVDAALAAEGETLYLGKTCYGCHGGDAVAGGMAPDLRASAIAMSEMEARFASVVRDGERLSRAMPAFPDITDAQLLAIRHYIRRQAHAAVNGP